MSNINLDIAKKLELIGIKKYQRYAKQIQLELDCLYDKILALAIFVRYSYEVCQIRH